MEASGKGKPGEQSMKRNRSRSSSPEDAGKQKQRSAHRPTDDKIVTEVKEAVNTLFPRLARKHFMFSTLCSPLPRQFGRSK
jgi:hypothetical protein